MVSSVLCPAFLLVISSVFSLGNVEDVGSLVLERTTFVFFSLEPSNAPDRLKSALHEIHVQPRIIDLTSEDLLDIPGYWTILPVLERVEKELDENTDWIVLVGEPPASMSLTALGNMLKNYKPKEDFVFGKGAKDKGPTVIHHYSSDKLVYPIFKYGLVFSRNLFSRLEQEYRRSPPTDVFSIDAGYELARFMKTRLGVDLTSRDEHFCNSSSSSDECAFRLNEEVLTIDAELEMLERMQSKIYIAVKTYHGYHDSRIPVLKRTWLNDIKAAVEIFSDEEDVSIPTVRTKSGNTDRGHCAKTIEILERYLMKKDQPWLLLVDDDTLISFPRICSLAANFDPDIAVAAGQRYGYMVARPGSALKYNYLTGGAGILMSLRAVEAIFEEGCRCSRDDDPDDMILGACMTAAGVKMVHRDGFHQARPSDYPLHSLAGQSAISFHKFTGMNMEDRTPENIYQRWLATPKRKHLVLNDEL